MKVVVETTTDIDQPMLTLRLPPDYPQREDLIQALEKVTLAPATLTVSQRGQTTQLPLNELMFIEATGHQVAAHTSTAVYRVPSSLTALGSALPSNFIRVSKSALVNTDMVHALTKTLTGNLIEFDHSPKQLYASRRYYQPLKVVLEEKGLLL
ncbi:LytTR family DNA-binding domain-containing protein [Lactiplantibacillus herbarum]|uniref:LytTR family DNA-binding domain-containing protein n=1 Tax=Lactiplantibacillus herbarum TaxID=1670446 RepID=UPI00064FEAB9|nr:LytTR family DNA-binding domain-containing protein [Lactiplantibacillus herbarum]